MSWDTSTAAAMRPSNIDRAVWSPCSGFIAITWGGAIEADILDPVTLQKLQTLKLQSVVAPAYKIPIFSPDSHILTISGLLFGHPEVLIVSWDLQTGGIVSIIRHLIQGVHEPHINTQFLPSTTYSASGKMVGVLYHWKYESTTTSKISIFDVASGIHMHSHLLDNNYKFFNDIWTEGESLLFATFFDAMTTVIWEVGFTSNVTPVEVMRFSAQMDNMEHLPRVEPIPRIPNRLVLIFNTGFLVWDSQASKPLLDCTDAKFLPIMSFSSDGHFFACQTRESGIFLWKESPTGYIFQGVLACHTTYSQPLLSPNGELILSARNCTIWLWPTKDFVTAPSRVLTQATLHSRPFHLDFSPDGALAAVTWWWDHIVTVLNLNSGVPWLTIDVDMEIHCLRITRNAVLVVGSSKVIAWDLPTGDCTPNIRMGLEDSSWTTNLDYQPGKEDSSVDLASISPDSCQIALIWHASDGIPFLSVYSTSTGVCHAYAQGFHGIPWFSPEGHDIWCVSHEGNWHKHLRIAGDELYQVHDEQPPEEHPWGSPHGYQVTDDWWVLDPDRKRLFMLPPPWRTYPVHRRWSGQFLAMLYVPEPVILELEAIP